MRTGLDVRVSTLPAFVRRELRSFLTCGLLCYGFARVHCSRCGKDLPVHPSLVEPLRTKLATILPAARVWPGAWWKKAASMLYKDLKSAGLDPHDASGRVLDFHGLRMSFISNLARAGVTPASAQKLARHSDVNLTMRAYTRLRTRDLAKDLAVLKEDRDDGSDGAEDRDVRCCISRCMRCRLNRSARSSAVAGVIA